MIHRLSVIAAAAVAALVLSACGDGDSSDDARQIPIEEWVAEFDRLCVETGEAVSEEMTEKEFAEISAAAVAEMRAIGEPSTNAAEARLLLDTIETQSGDTSLTGAEIEALDAEFLTTATALGVSDECLRGVPGE